MKERVSCYFNRKSFPCISKLFVSSCNYPFFILSTLVKIIFLLDDFDHIQYLITTNWRNIIIITCNLSSAGNQDLLNHLNLLLVLLFLLVASKQAFEIHNRF